MRRYGARAWSAAATAGTAGQKLAFIPFYLKTYPTFGLAGVFFGLDRSECSRRGHRLLPVTGAVPGRRRLLPKRGIRSLDELRAAFPQAREVPIDGMERPVRHPEKRDCDRKTYSGKKKRHTRKALVMAGADKRIGYLSPGFRGARRDKRLVDRTGVIARIPPDAEVLEDSGFQGIRHPGACLPVKGSRRRPPDDGRKLWNRLVSPARVGAGHTTGEMKQIGAARAARSITDGCNRMLSAAIEKRQTRNPTARAGGGIGQDRPRVVQGGLSNHRPTVTLACGCRRTGSRTPHSLR